MSTVGIAIYLVLAGLAAVQAVLVGMQTWEHRRFARSRLRGLPFCRAKGRAVLVVPCRGGDVGLEENLEHLMLQDYRDYEVRFVVESMEDPAWPLLRRVAARHPRVPTQIVFSGKAPESGQKVHNLRVATADLDEDVEFLAFVDADARPASGWLRALLSRLDLPDVGAVTGYRWFVPQRPSLANLLVYSINCNIGMLLGKKAPNFVWGGSWAIRRSTFEEIGLQEAWKGTLSDDLVASRTLRQHGHRVEYEPAAMVQSPLDYSLPGMFSFLRRQYIIGRYYAPGFWAFGFVMTVFASLMLLGTFAAAVGMAVSGSALAWLPASTFLLLYGAGVFRGSVRQDAATVYFPDLEDTLRAARRFDVWAGPLFGLVNGLALVAALAGRHVTWRGITYRLHRGGQIRTVHRDDGLRVVDPDRPDEPMPDDAILRPAARYRKAG